MVEQNQSEQSPLDEQSQSEEREEEYHVENQNLASLAKNDEQTQTQYETDDKKRAKKQLEQLTSALGVSPLKYQVVLF